MKSMSLIVAGAGMLCSHVASAKDQALAFISCPIVRDTSTVPCWLSEYEGQVYYLGIQTDVSAKFNPPSLGHKVLVEGVVSQQPDICGGHVLDPVTVSALPDLSPECDTRLAAEARYELPFEPPRPPGPSKGSLAFASPKPPAKPVRPFQQKVFTVDYDFDGMVNFQTPRSLTPALKYAQDVNAKRLEITGYRAAVRLSNGELAVEREGLGRARAEQIAELLRGAGLTTQDYVVIAKEDPEIGGPDLRRVTVRVTPGD